MTTPPTNRIHTYFSPVPELNMIEETKLLLLWRENWKAQGFETRVLNEWQARQHPYFAEFDQVVSQFPTVNPKAYEKACLHRHLAMAAMGGGILSDYDTFSRKCTPQMAEMIDWNVITIYQRGSNGVPIPCLISGNADAFLWLCQGFASYVPDERDMEGGRTHVSDMTIIHRLFKNNPEHFKVRPITLCFNEPGWEHSAAVHFSNGCTAPAGKTPRHAHVPQLLDAHPKASSLAASDSRPLQ